MNKIAQCIKCRLPLAVQRFYNLFLDRSADTVICPYCDKWGIR